MKQLQFVLGYLPDYNGYTDSSGLVSEMKDYTENVVPRSIADAIKLGKKHVEFCKEHQEDDEDEITLEGIYEVTVTFKKVK